MTPNKYTPEYIERRNQLIREAQARFNPRIKNVNYDEGLPTKPVGHASGLAIASSITTNYRQTYRPDSVNVTPQQVVDVLAEAGIRQWVLMGLYGYVGYLAQPRATQDVDVMIAEEELELAVSAFSSRWPTLEVKWYEVVVRFLDPGEVAIDGEVKQVLDCMRPSNPCHEVILTEYFRVDPKTGHRIPTLEAALASKYAALVSMNRDWDKKQQDAVDLRSIMVPNPDRIDRDTLHHLGELVFPGGGDELLEFLQLAIDKKPFPV